MPSIAYLSLGSNVGDRMKNLRQAITSLVAVGKVVKTSSFYETQPVEFQEQAWFINCVVELETDHSPQGLMAGLLKIERKMGRQRNLPKGPRSIDLDIVLYEKQVIDEDGLKVPHAAMHERRFVLAPLAEIAPDAIHPVFMRSASELLKSLTDNNDAVKKLAGE
ncbi:MAG TPA: 2-amino-4-hydroxy-6-hydroxymethyldihydropteridine diphosphokinase [Terriglobales bacterium]|nr:2-amino-4-hydroxy-6-hydroxymethyldihydropteridine diphosphokinase [Terriglobales bacterium]